MKTPEEIEKEIINDYHPITMKQAIHNTIWYMLDSKHLEDGNNHVLINNNWVEPTDEFNAIVEGIHNNLIKNKEAKDAEKN
jgi:hypothetical protein